MKGFNLASGGSSGSGGPEGNLQIKFSGECDLLKFNSMKPAMILSNDILNNFTLWKDYILNKAHSILTGGMLQSSADVAIDMSRKSQGMGFARIAKLVTSKNVNILKKDEDHSRGNGREVTVILPEKENEPKQE